MERRPIERLAPDQLARLPKYAQEQLRDLERRVADLERDLGVATQTTKPGRIVAREDAGGIPIVIPDAYDVDFDLGGQPGGGAEIHGSGQLSLSIRDTGGWKSGAGKGVSYLQVMANCATLVAIHTSSNVIALVPGYGAYEAAMEAVAMTRGVEFIAARRARLGLDA